VIERVVHTRNYAINADGVRALAGLLTRIFHTPCEQMGEAPWR